MSIACYVCMVGGTVGSNVKPFSFIFRVLELSVTYSSYNITIKITITYQTRDLDRYIFGYI